MRFYWPITKVDREQRMVWGYASTEAEDSQGEIVTRAALATALDDYMRFANIREMHQLSAVGVATEATIDDRGLYLGARIVDDDAWRKVVEGVYKGFSIGGRVTERDPAERRAITGLTLTEISVVDRPANPEAVFDCWKRGDPSDEAPVSDGPNAADDGLDYADPGYQEDGKKRYPLDSERHIRAAWAYIHLPHNAARYSADQLGHIKARIVAAWRERIDPNGPRGAGGRPQRHSARARKGLDEAGVLAQIVIDLDRLRRRLAAEAVDEGDASPVPDRLAEAVAELCDILEELVAEESGELLDDPDTPDPGELVAAAAGMLRKRRRPGSRPPAGGAERLAIETLASEILPRLDALQKRVEEIARTPLPPQTIARGFAGISKRGDGGVGLPQGDDIVAALAGMSEEERMLTLIKAAHANPIDPFARSR